MENQQNNQDSAMTDEDQENIEVILKPMNISEIHKREVKMTVSKYQLVGDLAKTLVSIMGLNSS